MTGASELRVVFTTTGDEPLFHEMVPLAWAMRSAGHEVRVVGPASLGEAITDTGLPAVLVDRPGGRSSLGGPLGGFVEFAMEWRADLVVGPCADRPGALMVSRTGLDQPVLDQLVLDVLPPSVRRSSGGLRMRYLPYHGPTLVGEALRRPPKLPWICLTSTGDDGVPIADLFDAVADSEFDVVAAVDAARVPPGTPIPDNLRLFDRCTLTTLLPRCAAIVHAGDVGAVLTAMALGVPQLALAGVGADRRLVELLAGSGACVLAGDPVDALEQAAAVAADVRPRRRAEELRAELHAAPRPHELVSELVRFAALATN